MAINPEDHGYRNTVDLASHFLAVIPVTLHNRCRPNSPKISLNELHDEIWAVYTLHERTVHGTSWRS